MRTDNTNTENAMSGVDGMGVVGSREWVAGCVDPETAAERATVLVNAGRDAAATTGDRAGESASRAYWEREAERLLAALLHAAALAGASVADVRRWACDPAGSDERVAALLRESGSGLLLADHRRFVDLPARPRCSITASLVSLLAPVAAADGGEVA
jgi:hypothetical protein